MPEPNGNGASPPLLVDSAGAPLTNSVVPDRMTRALYQGDTLALAALSGRRKLAKRAGIQYGGERDVYAAAGYVPEGELGFKHFHAMYKRGDVAGRIVDMPAQTTWRQPPEISVEGQEDHPFVEEFNSLAKRLRLWNRFERVDRLAGIGRYAVLFLGVRGEGDDADLRNPLPPLNGPDDVLFLTAAHEGDAKISKWVTDPQNPRYLYPEMYEIRFAGDLPGMSSTATAVHWTRIIHVAEEVLDNDVYGRPRLERCFNRLFDLDKILAATGESYWQLASRILTAKLDPEGKITDPALKDLGEKLEEIVHDLRRQFIGQGAELKWLESTPPDPAQTVKVYLFMIAAAANRPMRILFGTETGERASEQDERQWHGSIEERREQFAEPEILRAFIDRVGGAGGFEHLPEEYDAVWPNLYQPTPKEEQEANQAAAETAKALTPLGGDPRDLVSIGEDRQVYLRTSSELEELGIYVAGQEPEEPLPDLPPGPPEEEEEEA